MDISFYEHTVLSSRTGKHLVLRSENLDEVWSGAYGESLVIVKVTLHLEVGTPVLVDAFGRQRPGTVVKLGRTKVRVDYQQNQAGGRGERAFGFYSLYPTVGTPKTIETIKS